MHGGSRRVTGAPVRSGGARRQQWGQCGGLCVMPGGMLCGAAEGPALGRARRRPARGTWVELTGMLGAAQQTGGGAPFFGP